jgi:hypothetical protein
MNADKGRYVAGLLRSAADAIESGSCILTGEQMDMLLEELSNRPMNREQASIYLDMSASNFTRLVRLGTLPQGRKVAGFRELIWFKRDLDKYMKIRK